MLIITVGLITGLSFKLSVNYNGFRRYDGALSGRKLCKSSSTASHVAGEFSSGTLMTLNLNNGMGPRDYRKRNQFAGECQQIV